MKKLFLLALISSALVFFSCHKNQDGAHTVKYNVSSASTMNVTYTDADGNLKNATNVTSSWTYSFHTPGNGRVFQLIITSTNGSTVDGSIDVDGQQAAQNNSDTGSVTLSTQVP